MLIQANALHIPLADGSVHCCVTSPPYLGLRDYGTAQWTGGDPECDHKQARGGTRNNGRDRAASGGTFHDSPRVEDSLALPFRDVCGKCGATRIDSQLGLEPRADCLGWATGQPCGECYVCKMVAVFAEVKRVLREDGCVFLNLGDAYNTTPPGNKGFHYGPGRTAFGTLETGHASRDMKRDGLKPKDLCMIPARVALALQADGWWLRSDIVWSKPNPMPESVTDRPTKSHEYLFLLAKSERYFYDGEAIREPIKESTIRRLAQPNFDNQKGGPKDSGSGNRSERRTLEHLKERYAKDLVSADRQEGWANWDKTQGRNKRSVWEVATEPYPEAHFATYPTALVEPCILAGTSAAGCCPRCGKPWVRVVERKAMVIDRSSRTHPMGRTRSSGTMLEPPEAHTLGWQPACRCAADCPDCAARQDETDTPCFMHRPVPCLVLDPVLGSGTTAAVALSLGRRAVGLDLSRPYLGLAERRILAETPALFGIGLTVAG